MSLDQNLFTLHVTQNKDNPHVVDLVDPSGTIHYRKQRVSGIEYKAQVYDPLSESLLITATAPSSTSKFKTLELCNPTIIVELKYTGTLSFRWGFKWEDHDFEWKREECFMLRKPDPPVLVAITKEPAGRLKTTSIQILDYNLNRFDIDDRKGLEIVILTALLTFQDANEAYHTPPDGSPNSLNPTIAKKMSLPGALPAPTTLNSPPAPPPKPAPKTGVDRIAEMQAIRGEHNEVTIEEEGSVKDYAAYCCHLLEDEAMLFVTLRSSEPDQVPKVLQVVEQTKRIRHKSGLSDDEELYQYVLYDTSKKGPRRIVLDDKAKTIYTPPNSLTVHLSKIDMPELQPKAGASDKPGKDAKKKEEKKAPTTPSPSSSRPGKKINKLARSVSPTSRVQAHQVHTKQQSSPLPSQSDNPNIYVAPPPPGTSSRPSSSHFPSNAAPAFPTPQPPSLNLWSKPSRNSFHSGVGVGSQNLYGPGSHAPHGAQPASAAAAAGAPFSPHSLHAPQAALNIPPWQQPQAPSPSSSSPQTAGASPAGQMSSLVSGIFERLHRR